MQWYVITLNISQVKLNSSQALSGAVQEVMSSNDVADYHVAKVGIDRHLADNISVASIAWVMQLPKLGLEKKMFLMGCRSRKPEIYYDTAVGNMLFQVE